MLGHLKNIAKFLFNFFELNFDFRFLGSSPQLNNLLIFKTKKYFNFFVSYSYLFRFTVVCFSHEKKLFLVCQIWPSRAVQPNFFSCYYYLNEFYNFPMRCFGIEILFINNFLCATIIIIFYANLYLV